MSDNLIPEGRYHARATEAVLAKSGSGNWQVAVGFEIMSPESAAGRQITWYGSLSGTKVGNPESKNYGKTAAELSLESLEVCGWDGEGLEEASLASVSGGEVSLVIVHDEYEGKVNAKVRFINSPNSLGAAVKERANANEAANVTKKLQGLIMKRKQARQNKPQPQQRRQAPPQDAGDAWEPDDSFDDLPL